MIFIAIYFFVMIEQLAAFLLIGKAVFIWSVIGLVIVYALSFLMSKSKEGFEENLSGSKSYRKLFTASAIIGILMFTTSNLLPSKKDLAIIIAAGMTYEVLTSDAAKEVGGKAIELLKKQMDDALNDSEVKEILKQKTKEEVKNAFSS